MKHRLVIIGMGMAATRLADEILRRAPERFDICMIGSEPGLPYNRVLLSSLLAGDIAEGDLALKPANWFEANGLRTISGTSVTSIDRHAHSLTLADDTRIEYDLLILATGSDAIRLPVPGHDLPGVVTFRDLADVERIRASMTSGAKAVVIGGGLLGLEAAYGLAKAGVQTSVIHLMDRLMERQLDAEAAHLLLDDIAAQGIAFHLNVQTKAIHGTTQVESVELAGSTMIEADLVVMAVGIRPNAALARDAGLATQRGILVDDQMTTSDPDIFAIGECAEHRGIAYGLVEPAYEQARVLAAHLCGENISYVGSVTATNLKVHGIDLFSAGDFLGAEGTQNIVLRDRGLKTYRKLVVAKENGITQLKGCVLYGDTQDGLWYADLIRQGAAIDAMRPLLAFGRQLAERQAA
jgi:nitrite reductase (NADH) large subunit